MSKTHTAENVRVKLETVARTYLGRQAPLRGDDVLAQNVASDSLQRMTLIVEIENSFEVCLGDDEIAQLVTVDDVVALLMRKLAPAT